MAYLRTRKLGNIHGGRRRNGRVMQALGDYSSCLASCQASYDPDSTDDTVLANYSNCTNACASSTGSSSSGGTTTTPTTTTTTSSSSGGSSIWTGVGNLLGGIGKTLATPTPTVVQSGPDMTTILLIGGALVGVILLTKKRPAASP
jgi:hypothetical protein